MKHFKLHVQVKSLLPLIKCLRTKYSTSSTVNPTEIEHFNSMKQAWWDPEGNSKPLHMMNRLRVPFLRDGLIHTGTIKREMTSSATPLLNVSILDIGCGGGILSEALARTGGKVTGIDPSEELINHAKEHASLDRTLTNLTYEVGTVEQHAENFENHYDAVVASEVIEHVTRKDLFLEGCVRCLKPGGSIFITTVNKTIASWFSCVVLGENVFSLLPRGTHDWEKFVSPQRIQRTLEDCNCRTVVVHGMCYNPITCRWSWMADTSVNYALQGVKIVK